MVSNESPNRILDDENQMKNQLNLLEMKVSKAFSSLSLIFGPCIERYGTHANESHNDEDMFQNFLNFGTNFKLSIVDLIDREQQIRYERRQSIVILGLKDTGNDNQKINRLFNLLKQPLPTKINRIKSNNRKNYPEPVICELLHEDQVEKILNASFKLQTVNEFKNVYIN